MSINKICIVGLEDYAMLTGDVGYGHVGGESVQHVLLARAWRDLGLDVSIVVYDHGQPHVSVVDGIRVVSTFRPEGGIKGIRFLHPRLTGVIRAMREVDADVYYQSPAAPWSGAVAWFASRNRKRSILRIASDSDCIRKRKSARRRTHRWLYDYGVSNATLVAAQTERQRELLHEHYGVRSEILNIAAEPVARTVSSQKDIDVLWVGNFRHVKRPDVAIELARQLPEYRFAFVGGSVPGGEEYYSKIARQVREMPNVEFVGPVSYNGTGEWFDRSRLHINTSDYEGFPNTFLQAWVRRIPVVSFFDPDAVIRRRQLGRNCRDVAEMQSAIVQLLSDPAEREAIGTRAAQFASNEFSVRQIAMRYLDVLGMRSANLPSRDTACPIPREVSSQ